MSDTIGTHAWRFAVVGVLNTAVGLAVILCGMVFLGWGDVAANALGYTVGLVVSFVGNRSWTFGDRGPWGPALLRFLLVFAVAYLLNLLTLFLVRDGLHLRSYVAQIGGCAVYTIAFFLGSRTLAFRNPSPPRS